MSKKKFIKDFSYPDPNDPELQSKIFKKREFYYHRVPQRNIMTSYDEIQAYRNNNCKVGEFFEPREQQILLPNYINDNTPYKGVILMHGVGSGKTTSAIRVAEQFKDQVIKYNTKIYVVVPGPVTRENFRKELIENTGETYLKNREMLKQMSKEDINKEKNAAMYAAQQYYKILSYKTFYRKVLGEKIAEKKIVDDTKIKKSYRKNAEGEIEREVVIDKISNMNNSILIVDEAHNLSGNEHGDALKKIIKDSINLRVILLTATPMINLADEIVDLLNFIRPLNDQVQRDKIFTVEKNYDMKIKEGGLEYLKSKARGYISFYRGSIPYTFADRDEKGEIPKGLLFTPVIKNYMEDFQYKTYLETTKNIEDTLDRGSTAAGCFVFPALNKNNDDIIGCNSTEGTNTVINQLKNNGNKLRALINKKLYNNKIPKDEIDRFILLNDKNNITGSILQLKYVKKFSIKYFNIITNLNKLVEGRGTSSATAFIYSNIVKAGGIELFAEALLQNGYLEYQEDGNYDINDETIDYKTGLPYSNFKKNKNIHNFKPATFILITGGADESEEIPEVKQKIIREVFNDIDNVDGKNIKFVLGSRVMNEGVTLKNVKEVHILDVFFNIPKMEQVIGRAVRMCVHKDAINDEYKFPKVAIYRYVIGLKNELSTDELLYQRAEIKYLTIKDIERALKEIAFDCPLLLHVNMFPEEIEKYKNCVYPTLENVKAGKTICPALCDFRRCDIKCDDKKLNQKYWNEKKGTYKKLDKDEIDYNTFNDDLAKQEIDTIKNKIKDLFRFKHVYTYEEILEEIKKSLLDHQTKLFDEYFLYEALRNLEPKTENEFNNFTDTIYDKFNIAGYLIHRGKYYIFQPYNENENIPMYYRQNLDFNQTNQISLNNYITQKYKNVIDNKEVKISKEKEKPKGYDFDSTLEYYKEREENFIVGIIDKNTNMLASNDPDLFKIRPKITKSEIKKRGTGITTFKGAVCTTKEKEYILKLIEKLSKKDTSKLIDLTKDVLCNQVRDLLLHLEKYSRSQDNNKMTYVIIPNNHDIYPFPYNLEDRIKYKIKQISDLVNRKIENRVIMKKDDDNNIYYELVFNNDSYFKNHDLNSYGFELINNKWTCLMK